MKTGKIRWLVGSMVALALGHPASIGDPGAGSEIKITVDRAGGTSWGRKLPFTFPSMVPMRKTASSA